MLRFLLHDPEATALTLLLLLLAGTLAVGWWQARKKARKRSGQKAGQRPTTADPNAGDSPPSRGAQVNTWPHLLRAELLATLVTLLLLTWWAMVQDLPLGPQADPDVTPRVAKAPWFFVGVQETLQYFDAWMAGAVLPLLMILALTFLPYLEGSLPPRSSGRWLFGGWVFLLFLLWLGPLVAGFYFRGENWLWQPAWAPMTPDQMPAHPARTLGQALGLGPAADQVLGGLVVLSPFLLLLLVWRHTRQRAWAKHMGPTRFALNGTILVTFLGVLLKVILVLGFDVRYFWQTPWFRL